MIKKISAYTAVAAILVMIAWVSWNAFSGAFVNAEASGSNAPTVQTVAATDIKQTAATIRGTYNNNGGDNGHIWFEYGSNADASSWPNTNKVGVHGIQGTSLVNESVTLNNLFLNTTYYYRIIAENDKGRTQGSIMSFKTLANGGTNTSACASNNTLSLAETQNNISSGKIKVTLSIDNAANQVVGTIVNNTGCGLPVSQLTYKMFDRTLATQQLFDYAPNNAAVITVAPGQTATLRTNLTSCMTQTDIYYGDGPHTLNNDNRDGVRTLSYLFDQNTGRSWNDAAGNFCKQVYTATLKIVKTVTNDNGGTKQVSDFALFQNGTRVNSGEVKTYTFSTTNGSLPITVSETNLPGYTAGSWTGDCTADGKITLHAGENKTCTINNNDNPPTNVPTATLKIVKTVINDNGGTKQVSDFKLFQDGVEVTSNVDKTYSFASSNDNKIISVSENNLSGYTAGAWGGDCSADGKVTLHPGEHKSCTITNNDNPPTTQYGCIAIHKEAYDVNNNRINPTPAFTFKVDNNNNITTDSNGNALVQSVPVGNHTVSEVVPSGWTLDSVVPASNGVVNVGVGSGCAEITFKNKQVQTGGNFGLTCAVTPNKSFYTNEAATFVAYPTGGTGSYTYSWTGEGFTSTNASISQAFGTPGVKTATVVVTSGSQSLTAQCSVTVIQAPGSCVGSSCGGGGGNPTPNPVTVTREGGGQVAGVFLSQVPYTGIGSNMKIALFMLALFSWSAWISYLIIKRKAKKHGVSVSAVFQGTPATLAFAGGPSTQIDPRLAEINAMKTKAQGTIPVMTAIPRAEITATPVEPKKTDAVKSPFLDHMQAAPAPVQTAKQPVVEAAPAPKYEPAITLEKPQTQSQSLAQIAKPNAQIVLPSSAEDVMETLENRARELHTLISADGLKIIANAAQSNKHNATIILNHLVELYRGSEQEVEGDWMVLNADKIGKILFSTYLTMTPVFIGWLAQGDDKKTMAFIRMIQMQGQAIKDFVMNIVIELDKAYRFRVENMGDADASILDATMNWSNQELETVIHTLVTAVDQTYSSVYSSVKIALVKVLDLAKAKHY